MAFNKTGGAGGGGGGDGAVPGGSDGEVQFNDAGAFAGDSGLVYDPTTQTLTGENAVLEGNLTVKGTTTSVNSETLNIADNHIVLNAGNTFLTDETGGLVVNTAADNASLSDVTEFTASVGIVQAFLTTTGVSNFATNDLIEISLSDNNNGIYEVASIDEPNDFVFIRGLGTVDTIEDWTDRDFVAELSTTAKVVKVTVSVLLANSNQEGTWGEASGSTTSGAAPFVFNLFNQGLQFVVGKGTNYKYNLIQDAINAAIASGQLSVVIVTPGLYTESITIADPNISLFAPVRELSSVNVEGFFTIQTTSVGNPISITGISFTGPTLINGTVDVEIRLNDCSFRNAAGGPDSNVIKIENTGANSLLVMNNCNLRESITNTWRAILRSDGDMSVEAVDCIIRGDLQFAVLASAGSVTLTSCTTTNSIINLSNSNVVCTIRDSSISSLSVNECLSLSTFGGTCTVIGGLMDVPNGGDVVLPATGASFFFSNVATTANTILTTEMGTRLDSDGVSLLSGQNQDSDTFLNATGDYSEIPGLQFVVGINSGGSFKYPDIQSAITAAEVIGESASIIVEPGIYTGDIEITKPGISLFAASGKSTRTEINGTLTLNTSVIGNISIAGFLISDQVIISGTANTSVLMSDCIIVNAGNNLINLISIINSSVGVFEIYDCQLIDLGVIENVSISRTVGNMSLIATNCIIGTSIEFKESLSTGDVTLNLCNIISGSVDLSGSAVACSLNSTNITSVSASACLELGTFTGSVTVIGGLLDVPSNGNAVNPDSSNGLSFSNVATTAGTLLTTEMGTRLDSDGVSLLSGTNQDSDTFLNAQGDYSSVPVAPLSSTTSNLIFLNAANTSETDVISGFIANTDAIGSVDVGFVFGPGDAGVSNPVVTTQLSSNFATNDLVQISGSDNNDGIYEVLSSLPTTLIVRGVGLEATVESWTKDNFISETSSTSQMVKVNVSILFTNTDGNNTWGEASGSETSLASPFEFGLLNHGLQFVVGKSVSGFTYQFETIQEGVNAAAATGEPSIVIVTPGEYPDPITIGNADVSLFGVANKLTSVNVTANLLLNVTTGSGPISISGMSFVGNAQVAGLSNIEVRIKDCSFDNAGTIGNALLLNNTGATSLLVMENCSIRETVNPSAHRALLRSDGNMSVEATNCIFKGDIQLSVGSSSGSLTLTSCTITEGLINISNGMIVCNIRDTSLSSRTTDTCLVLNTFTGTCTVIGGVMDVPSGGDVVTPLSSNNFTFSNVATTSGTDLDTTMGTRLDSDGVSLLSGAGQDSNSFLNATGVYSSPAALSAATVQVFTEADINAAFGDVFPWVLANVNLQVMANITLTAEKRFLIDTTSATIYGVDRNASSITGDVTGNPLFDFTADSGSVTDNTLVFRDINFTQNGTGALIREDGLRFILKIENCGMTGNTTGGNIDLLNGQFLSISDGLLSGGGNIIQGDGTADNPGIEFIFLLNAFLMITDLFADDQRCIEFMPNSVTERLSTTGFSILLNPSFGPTPRTGGIGMYFHATCSVRIFDFMEGGFSPFEPSSRSLVVEDTSAVKFGLLGGNTFEGAGELYQCFPNLQTPTVTITLSEARGLAFDGTNLMAASTSGDTVTLYEGLTATVDGTPLNGSAFTPASTRTAGLTWYRGNLVVIDIDGTGRAYLQDGFTETTTASIALTDIGLSTPRDIATDGTNFMIIEQDGTVTVTGPDLFDGGSVTILDTFTVDITAGTFLGIDYDGINLIITDAAGATILVMKGISPIQQYQFGGVAANTVGIVITNEGYVEGDFATNSIFIFDNFPTFDETSSTWQVMTNVGEQEQIQVDPIDDLLWSPTAASIASGTGELVLTNSSAANGFAEFTLDTVIGHTYRVTNGYRPGDSNPAASAIFSIRDAASTTEIVTSGAISVAGNVVLSFTAIEQTAQFRFLNNSVISGETSNLTSLSQIDESYKIVESSDKGGSIYTDTTPNPIAPVLADGVFSDIGDAGLEIFYGPLTVREKSILSDQNNGVVKITSTRDRGQTIQGALLAQTLAASPGAYELAVVINGKIQDDSIGTYIWSNNNEIQTISTLAITRTVTEGDEIKLQVRPVGHSVNLGPFRCALSHSQ